MERVFRLDARDIRDQFTVERTRAAVMEAIEICQKDDVFIVDCSYVESVSSSFLGIMIRLHKNASRRGVKVVLRDLRNEIHHVFEVTRLAPLFEFDRKGSEDDGG